MDDPVDLAGGALVAPSITGANGLWLGALVSRIATDIDGTVVSPDGDGGAGTSSPARSSMALPQQSPSDTINQRSTSCLEDVWLL